MPVQRDDSPMRVPEMEPYVLSLLVVAAEGTKAVSGRPALVENAALRVALEWMGDLPGAASQSCNGVGPLAVWLAGQEQPETAFGLCAQLIDAIDQVVRGRHPCVASSPNSCPTKFDQHTFQAVAQTIAARVGFRNGMGATAKAALAALSKQDARGLQQHFLRNYLGNVLQDYFDECGIRAAYPELPENEEEVLRTEDGEALAETVFEEIKRAGIVPPDEIIAALRRLLSSIWLAEQALDP